MEKINFRNVYVLCHMLLASSHISIIIIVKR
jgi:hypothetical protein